MTNEQHAVLDEVEDIIQMLHGEHLTYDAAVDALKVLGYYEYECKYILEDE